MGQIMSEVSRKRYEHEYAKLVFDVDKKISSLTELAYKFNNDQFVKNYNLIFQKKLFHVVVDEITV